MEKVIWNEETIRNEFRRLDTKFELDAASLPIVFNNAKRTLGSFYGKRNGDPMRFQFSRYYFDNPKFPPQEALDTIRHEYAHYMDFMLTGKTSHGPTWKKCCIKVGATPVRCYDERRAAYRLEKHEETVILELLCDDIRDGMELEHPKYGVGVIGIVEGEGIRKHLYVEFPQYGTKKIAASWAAEHCKVHEKT